MNYARPEKIPPFVYVLKEQKIDISELKQAIDTYLANAEICLLEIDVFNNPEEYLNAQEYLDRLRDLQTIFFYEGFKN